MLKGKFRVMRYALRVGERLDYDYSLRSGLSPNDARTELLGVELQQILLPSDQISRAIKDGFGSAGASPSFL